MSVSNVHSIYFPLCSHLFVIAFVICVLHQIIHANVFLELRSKNMFVKLNAMCRFAERDADATGFYPPPDNVPSRLTLIIIFSGISCTFYLYLLVHINQSFLCSGKGEVVLFLLKTEEAVK